ncbi:MAG: Pr6Pr family membrane protein [Gemmatimonadota bacterium]
MHPRPVRDWWLFAPKGELRWRAVGAWLAYPLGFFAYSLIRGELTGLYAYPFIDVDVLGYGRVLVNAVAVLAGFALICLVLVGVGRSGSAGLGGRDTSAADSTER